MPQPTFKSMFDQWWQNNIAGTGSDMHPAIKEKLIDEERRQDKTKEVLELIVDTLDTLPAGLMPTTSVQALRDKVNQI